MLGYRGNSFVMLVQCSSQLPAGTRKEVFPLSALLVSVGWIGSGSCLLSSEMLDIGHS